MLRISAKNGRSWLAGLCLVAAAASLFAPPTAAAGTPTRQRIAQAGPIPLSAPDRIATAVRIESRGDTTRIVFDLTEGVRASAFALAAPDRIVVELPEINFQIDPAVGQGAHPPVRKPAQRGRAARPVAPDAPLSGVVASFRFGLFAPGKSRIVIDLAEPARVVKVASEIERGADRLVIELQRSDRAAFLASVRKPVRAAEAPAAPVSPPAEQASGGLPLIVLDAGHGGVDTGARSPDGTLEKDIVFDFARALAAHLDQTGRYRVLMTRSSDIFVPLGERVKIARTAGAALFVSIHADTLAGEPGVSGATVYTVSDKASDSEAARVADSENQADLVAGLENSDEQSEVSDILFDLTRRETRAFSHVFARTLVGYWKEVGRLNKNPQRSAGFRVLKAPDVPSVLLELGYLSSDKDLAGLVAPEWRARAAATVGKSIDQFFRSRGTKDQAEGAANGTNIGLRPGSTGSDMGNVAASAH